MVSFGFGLGAKIEGGIMTGVWKYPIMAAL